MGPAGKLAAALQQGEDAGQADSGAEAGADGGTCEAHLTCARETAKHGGGALDQKNICGAVCCHCVPAKELFMTSPAHENFTQYVALVAVAREHLPELAELLVDINCQLSKHLEKQYPHLVAGLGCHIGWLHAKAGHNLECQLQFNAMFAAELGRLFGESIEQCWAGVKPVARIQRYEALPHRLVTLELALHHFAMGKYVRCWELLLQTHKHCQRRKAQLEQELTAALQVAEDAGYEVDPSANFQLSQQDSLKLSDAEVYVKKLATKAIYDSLTARGGSAVIAGLDTSTGRALAVQVNAPGFLSKLDGDLDRLRRKLHISVGDWTPAAPEYQEAAASLRAAMLRNTEVKVERHVSFLSTLQEDRGAEVQSGHNTGLIRDKIRYRVRQIRELMAVWEGWLRFNQSPDFQPPAWEEADVFSNVLPWTAASAAQGLTEQHVRYKVYCIAQELQRCEEEQRFLPQDAVNTLCYFQHQQRVLADAVAATISRGQQTVASAEQAICRGQVHTLQAWQARIAIMQRKAAQAFQKAGWLAATNPA